MEQGAYHKQIDLQIHYRLNAEPQIRFIFTILCKINYDVQFDLFILLMLKIVVETSTNLKKKIVHKKDNHKYHHLSPSNHLIDKIVSNGTKGHQENLYQNVQMQKVECNYGVYCSHLRAEGKCKYLHKRNHYLILNIVPSSDCLEEEGQNQIQNMSKKQKKQKKIIQKTIKQFIDVDLLSKKQRQQKVQNNFKNKALYMENLNEVERKIHQLLESEDIEAIYQKLNIIKEEKIIEIKDLKRRFLIQLKKKKDDLFKQFIERQYKIASRLIKTIIKYEKMNQQYKILEVFIDINFDTNQQVRKWYQSMFSNNPQINLNKQNILIYKILNELLFTQPNKFEKQYYLIERMNNEDKDQLINNIQLFNMIVPHSLQKKLPFVKYLLIDCQTELSLTAICDCLQKDYLITFYSKCKPYPEYPFGQLETNKQKCDQWIKKIKAKYDEQVTQYKIVLVLSNPDALILKKTAQQFEKQKVRQKSQALTLFKLIFSPITYVMEENVKNREQIFKILNLNEPNDYDIIQL